MKKQFSTLIKLLYKQGNKYHYQKESYSQADWFYQTTNFHKFDEEAISLRKPTFKLSLRYLKEIFSYNVFKSTFLTMILPCVVFLLLSLIVFLGYGLYHYRGNFADVYGDANMRIYLLFIAIVFLVLALILFIKTVVLKEKVCYGKLRGNKGYSILKDAEYRRRLDLYDKHIPSDYIFFKSQATNRLIIREFTEIDSLDYYQIASNPHVAKYMGWSIHKNYKQTVDLIIKTREEYQENNIFRLGIELKDEKKIIGYIGLSRYDLSATTCQIVYALSEEYWHHGYVKEALIGFIEYLKNTNKTTIYASHVAENIASGKVLTHCGFIRDQARDTKMMIYDVEEQIISYIYSERKEN